ncbi:alpha/beta hydrolase family protein [Rheinheimera sp.]|uniref:alpha/beta hydrolase family protein n=1 Tax=Rheinheimera sp. TaxID=1869214 RepID=UPI002FDD4582
MSFRWRNWSVCISRCLLCVVALTGGLVAAGTSADTPEQLAQQRYQQLLQNVGAGLMRLSPDQQWLVLASKNGYPSIHSKSNAAHIELLGREFDRERPLESGSLLADKLTLIQLNTGQSTELSLPDRQINDVFWAPDSKSFAMIGVSAKALDVWRFNLSAQQPEFWSEIAVSGQLDSAAIVWLPDSQSVVIRHSAMQPLDTSTMQTATLQVTKTQSVQTRVYRHTLDSEFALLNFAGLLRQQAVLLRKNGEKRPLTAELLLESISVSPDGRYLLVQHFADEIQPGVMLNRLAREYQIVEIANGKVSAILPKLQTDQQGAREADSAASGPRLLQWRPDAPATLVWVQSLEPRGHKVAAQYRDAVMSLAAPFNELSQELFKSQWRLHQLYLSAYGRLIYTDFHAGLKQLRYWSLQFNTIHQTPTLLTQYDYTNQAEFPGELVTQSQPDGRNQLVSKKSQEVYFLAKGQHRWGDGAYLIRQGIEPKDQLTILKPNHQQHSQTPVYLRIQNDSEWFIVSTESAQRAPSLWLHKKNSADLLIYDWHSEGLSPTPKPVLLEFKRNDGVQMYSQLYLPKLKGNELLPAVIWLYPREYRTHQQQPKPSQQEIFVPIDPLGPLVALDDGFAVVDASHAPIIRQDGQEPNDTFMHQQQQNISALITALKNTGRVDTSRLVLMGHSYGAFSALSLLTGRADFRCAIARSGAYNRSLTPLGFQGEKRTLWQAPELYQRMSPFFDADKIKTPVLLIHGMADENPGTSPLQSEMMFQALQANKQHAKLLLLKKERHVYRYQETIKQMLTEQSGWLRECAQLN